MPVQQDAAQLPAEVVREQRGTQIKDCTKSVLAAGEKPRVGHHAW